MQQSSHGEFRSRQELDLNRFAEEFKDEAHLRKVLADLLVKAGATGVRITHAPNERGKDIIFYRDDGLSKNVLFACVIKNDRITGRADSNIGAATVLNQATQALIEPYVSRSTGAEERVRTVYVMSPQECTPTAIESIRQQLRERSGQIEFICGLDLFAQFQRYWPDFIRFESAVQTRYLTDLRAGLSIDKALIELLARHNANLGLKPFEAFYVPSGIELRMDIFRPPTVSPPRAGIFAEYFTYDELKDFLVQLSVWRHALRSSEVVEETAATLQFLTESIDRLSILVKTFWANALPTKRMRHVESRGIAPKVVEIEERLLSVSTDLCEIYDRCTSVFSRLSRQIGVVEKAATSIKQSARTLAEGTAELLQDPKLIEMSAGYDYLNALPGIVRHEIGKTLPVKPEVMFTSCKAVLISGPPGSGKTSFCRWHTIKAVDAFLNDSTLPLPVYVPAHRLTSQNTGGFEDIFLGGADFANLWAGNGNITDVPIRLFLDGLDEVADRDQQRLIIEILRQGLSRYRQLTVIVTSRPYIWGAWLDWMPRLHISELKMAEQQQLARNWLGQDEQVKNFFRDVSLSVALERLMGIPLLATLILNLYRKTPRVPENKASLYRAFVDLYCGGWDMAKGLVKTRRFGTEQKLRPLAALAYRLHISHVTGCPESTFTYALADAMPAFVPDTADFLAEVIEDGILVRAGRELVFAHLSFQEYLAAQYLASDPSGERPKRALRAFLRGEDWWKEVVEFYIISRDDPSAVDDWIRKVAEKLREKGAEIKSSRSGTQSDMGARLKILSMCLYETFPGYKSHFC
jgi:NACHT domain-containing protein